MLKVNCFAQTLAAFFVIGASSAHAVVISGTSSGTFVNPLPAGSFSTGVGTGDFTFGDPAAFGTGPSRLIFSGVPFDTTTEADFLIGTLSYFNGTVSLATVPSTVELSAQLNFANPPAGMENFNFTLQLLTTPNVGTPDENADAVVFPDSFSPTVFTLDGVQYTLQSLGFRNVVGDGFIGSDFQSLNARESSTASAELFGRVTADFPRAIIPEPSSIVTFAVGLASLTGYTGWRRRRTIKPKE